MTITGKDWRNLRFTPIKGEWRGSKYYTWKSLNGLVLFLGLSGSNDQRKGHLIVIPKNTGTVQRIKIYKNRSIQRAGARIFNKMPRIVRDYEGEYKGFKELVDKFLDIIPDCPCLLG